MTVSSPERRTGARNSARPGPDGLPREHVTEIQRFTSDGDIESPLPSQRELGIACVLVVKHKSGEQHRTAVSAKTN